MRLIYLICTIIVLSLFLLAFWAHRRRAKIIQKIRSMPGHEKCALLNDIIRPFGYAYIPSKDIFTSRLDAWQREFGYCALYDKSAVHFNMVLDYLPVYFNYQGETWLIEFWKGQYGINTGCEIGVYHAGRILERRELESALFKSVDNSRMFKLSLTLSTGSRVIARLSARHWWLTAFLMGTFCIPSELALYAALSFPTAEMADAFYQGILNAGYAPGEVERRRSTVAFGFHPSARIHGVQVRVAQWSNHFWCNVYVSITKPFSLSIDKILYLYEFLPFAFRKMLRIRRFKGIWGKGGLP